ncbi:hypothetical protein DPMN_008547 [Dreissena polymorpha]|uniref:Uncharacterized protein n=1 Tax=Dreissena polymorpha TaxID=45954 RepID=A0A9D4RXF5_DREPO|nr:hypothetical protein DPMN_008547 [Dreissena polymorpha]
MCSPESVFSPAGESDLPTGPASGPEQGDTSTGEQRPGTGGGNSEVGNTGVLVKWGSHRGSGLRTKDV